MSDQAPPPPLDPTNKPSPSPSPQRHSTDILSLQKELEDKQHDLNIAYQTSLELIDTNNDLQQQFEEQSATLQALDGNLIDCQMKIDLLERENQEYQQTINQTNDKYEELLGELAVTREHLNNAMNEITEYQSTIQSINHDIIHNTSDAPPSAASKHDKNNSELALSEHLNDHKDKLERQQKKYDELLREHERYRNERELFILLQIDFDEMKKEALKMEKRNKLLSDQIVDLTYSNVQLEKEINDYSMDLDEKNNTIQYLQNENQTLMTQKLNANKSLIDNTPITEPNKLSIESKQRLYSSYGGPDSILSSFVKENTHNKEMDTLKRRLSVQLRDNFGYNSKLVMFANNIDENNPTGSLSDLGDEQDEDANDLFTMVQSYENNEEYLRNAESHELDEINEESLSELSDKPAVVKEEKEEKSISPPKEVVTANKSREEKAIEAPPKPLKKSKPSPVSTSKSPRSQTRSGRRTPYKAKKRNFPRGKPYRKTDALDEYLHLTASAVKINYPTVNATSQELIQMVRSMPFYQAHDHLNRYMMDRLRWEQIQQNKLLQLKAAAIQAQRDHERQHQSGVTRFLKKWFTTEYDDEVDDIVNNREPLQKGNVALSSPLSKKENLRLNRVGKAKIRSTKSGGTSVNLGSLNPNGIPPKGANRKKRAAKSNAKAARRRMNEHESPHNRRQKEREQKLKTLSITQTLPSSRINDKNVQKMLEINAEYLDKVIQTEAQKQDKKRKKPSIRLTVPVKGANQARNIQNAEPPDAKKPQKRSQAPPKDAAKKKPKRKPSGAQRKPGAPRKDPDAKPRRAKPKRRVAAPLPQKQGWFSWLSGTQPPPPQHRERKRRPKPKAKKAREQAFVSDPYALAANHNAPQANKAKDKDAKPPPQSKTPKPLLKEKEEDKVDLNENIKRVIDAQKAEPRKEDVKGIEDAKEEEEIQPQVHCAKAVDAMDKDDTNESEERKDVSPKEVEPESKAEEHEDASPQEDMKREIQNEEEEQEEVISPLSPEISVPSLIISGDRNDRSIDDLEVRIETIPNEKEEEDQKESTPTDTDRKEEDEKPSIPAVEEEDPYALNPEDMPDISVMELRHTPLPPDDRNSDSSDHVTLDVFSPPIQEKTKPIQPPQEDVIESNLDEDNSDDLDDVLQPVFDEEEAPQVNEEPEDIPQNITENESPGVDPPAGTKRRGSVEAIPPPSDDDDDEAKEPTPGVTPVANPTDDNLKIESQNPTDDDIKSNGARVSAKTRSQRTPVGHRRRNTDSTIGYTIGKSSFAAGSSNAAIIKLMQSELPPSQRLDMQRKASDLKLERELKHAQIKLQETQDQCGTAVEIIGNLQKENEDLLSSSETLRAEHDAAQTEIKILEQKVKSLEEVYRSDTRKLEEEVDSTKRQLSDLHEDMTQKDMALSEANDYRQSMQKRLNQEQNDTTDGDHTTKRPLSQKEKELMEQVTSEKRKLLDKDGKIERLLAQLEGATRLKHDNETLQTEIESLRVLAQQDLEMQNYQIEKMTQEIILLGSSNSQLVQEKEDLMALLEERNYENQMLKTGYGLHRTKTHANMDGVIAQLAADGDEDFDDEMNVEFANKEPMTLEDLEQYSGYDDYNSRDSLSGSPMHRKPEKKVADVTREYLHLTASVVNMKFPRIQYSSEELIAKVKNYQFWEYHDMMVRIMKTEEVKMLEKQKAEQAAKANAAGNTGGMLGRFRNFFGKNQNQNQGGDAKNMKKGNRRSMMAPKTQLKGIKTRARNQSEHSSRETRGPSTIDKKAPSAPISMDDAKKKMMKFKESAKKKITGNPSEEDAQEMSNMSFASVPFVGIKENENTDEKKGTKPKKPDQGL